MCSLQVFDQRSTEIGLDSTSAWSSSQHDRKLSSSSCLTAAENTFAMFTFKIIHGHKKTLIYCHWNDHETACQWTLRWSGTLNSLYQTSLHIDFSLYDCMAMWCLYDGIDLFAALTFLPSSHAVFSAQLSHRRQEASIYSFSLEIAAFITEAACPQVQKINPSPPQ